MINKKSRTPFLSVTGACIVSVSCMSSALAQTDDALQFSGFARVVLGNLDENDATYLGYDGGLSLDRQSLIGLHAEYQILDNFSVTGQFVGRSAEEQKSGIDWLYFTYEPTRATQIKLGKQRTPFFHYSDSIDVGFSYPWITLPQQVYSSVLFPTFDGALANYQWSGKEFSFEIESYWGRFDEVIFIAGEEVNTKVNDLRGIITKINYDNWAFRASYHTADAILGLTELRDFSAILKQYGFIQSAESLNPDGEVDFYQISASYENLNYFFRVEATQTYTQSSPVPDIDAYFFSVGYNYYPFLSYVSFGKNESSYPSPLSEIPIGYDPQLDGLAFGYQTVFNSLPGLSSKSITLGTRWDWKANLALKAEVTWTEALDDNSAHFVVRNAAAFDSKATLYQLALEWVF